MFKRIYLVSLILICLIGSSFADNQVRETRLILWTGAVSNDFSNPANWVGDIVPDNVVPGPNDRACFNVPASTTNSPMFFEGTHNLCYLSRSDGDGKFTINGGTLNLHEYWGGDGFGHGGGISQGFVVFFVD